MNVFLESVKENAVFVAQVVGIFVALFVVAFLAEKLAQKCNGVKEKVLTTRKMAMIGMFSAISAILIFGQLPPTAKPRHLLPTYSATSKATDFCYSGRLQC